MEPASSVATESSTRGGSPSWCRLSTPCPPTHSYSNGEVAVYARALISRFEWLRGRPKDEPATLPVCMVFDVLELGGKDLRREPLWKRRKALEELVAGARMILPARRLSDNGLKAWAQAVHRGYEGMGKDPESLYVPGRTLKWLK